MILSHLSLSACAKETYWQADGGTHGRHMVYLPTGPELKIYAEDETRETHQAIYESEYKRKSIDEGSGPETGRCSCFFFIELRHCLPSIQTCRSVLSDDCDNAVHDDSYSRRFLGEKTAIIAKVIGGM